MRGKKVDFIFTSSRSLMKIYDSGATSSCQLLYVLYVKLSPPISILRINSKRILSIWNISILHLCCGKL